MVPNIFPYLQGYHFGLVKLEVKSKTSTGVEFTAGGVSNTDGGAVSVIFLALIIEYVRCQ